MRYGQDRYRPQGNWAHASQRLDVMGERYRLKEVRGFARAVLHAEEKGWGYGIELQPEPNNPHDRFAIQVMGIADVGGEYRVWHIGYVPAEECRALYAEFIDQGLPLKAELSQIYEGDCTDDFFDIEFYVLRPSQRSNGKFRTMPKLSEKPDTTVQKAGCAMNLAGVMLISGAMLGLFACSQTSRHDAAPAGPSTDIHRLDAGRMRAISLDDGTVLMTGKIDYAAGPGRPVDQAASDIAVVGKRLQAMSVDDRAQINAVRFNWAIRDVGPTGTETYPMAFSIKVLEADLNTPDWSNMDASRTLDLVSSVDKLSKAGDIAIVAWCLKGHAGSKFCTLAGQSPAP